MSELCFIIREFWNSASPVQQILEVCHNLIEILQWGMGLLIWLCIVYPSDPLSSNVGKEMNMRMHLWKIP